MEYDREKYKVWKLPNVLLLHWVLNPALAVNEIFLGQRVPKVMVIDTTSTAPLMARQYVPCEKCGTFHDSRLWAKSNAFGHWFGIICPKCGEKIPCLLNIASLIILVVTFPLWIVLKSVFEKR